MKLLTIEQCVLSCRLIPLVFESHKVQLQQSLYFTMLKMPQDQLEDFYREYEKYFDDAEETKQLINRRRNV